MHVHQRSTVEHVCLDMHVIKHVYVCLDLSAGACMSSAVLSDFNQVGKTDGQLPARPLLRASGSSRKPYPGLQPTG